MSAISKSVAPHYVTGHRNPDTDALVSAHVAAWLDRTLQAHSCATAVRLGEATPQSLWLFAQAGVALPQLRRCCRYRAEELARPVPVVSTDTPLSSVLAAIQKDRASFAAVCTPEGRLLGTVSDHHQRTNLLLQCNVEDFIGTLLQFEHLVNGLPIRPLNQAVTASINRLLVVLHKHNFGGDWDAKTAIIIGERDLLLDTIRQNPPGVVIFTGIGYERACESAAHLSCPCYLFKGSVIQLCSRLSGCFPASAAMEESFVSVETREDAREVERLLRKNPDGVVVLDPDGRMLGAITAQMLIEAPTPKLTLVDHSESGQSIEGLEEAEIVAIYDHHRLGDIESIAPLEIDVRPLGSTATILYQRASAAGLRIPREIGILLLGAIIADTLLLVSPTTTAYDRTAVEELAELSGLDLLSFGKEVLRTNDHLASADAEELVLRDCKLFKQGEVAFLAAQIETVDLGLLNADRASALRTAMARQVQSQNSAFGLLMVTDVVQAVSRLCVVDTHRQWAKRLEPDSGLDEEGFWSVANMVSRKKQLIPWLLQCLRA